MLYKNFISRKILCLNFVYLFVVIYDNYVDGDFKQKNVYFALDY